LILASTETFGRIVFSQQGEIEEGVGEDRVHGFLGSPLT